MTYNKRSAGAEYELMASDYLIGKGYRILRRNYRVRQAEIDIIAFKDDTYVFVEVKYRKNSVSGTSLEAVTVTKQKKISKAALYYMNQNRIDIYTANIRFDVIGIDGGKITHIENAFSYIG